MSEPQITESMIVQAMQKAMGQANTLMNGPQVQQPMQAQPMQQAPLMPAPQQQTQQMGALPNPQGWSVPVETDMGGITVTVYVQFPAHTFPQYQQIIATMMNMGYNIRSYQKNNGYGGNSGSSWGNRGGGSWGNRGGYQGRGGWNRGY